MRLVFGLMACAVVAGPVFAQQMDCSAPETQTDLTLCANQEWGNADEALNGAYQDALGLMRWVDSDLAAEDQGAQEALREGQRAWVTFRDNACLAEAYVFFGGSIRPMVELNCKARLTWVRVADLQLIMDQMH